MTTLKNFALAIMVATSSALAAPSGTQGPSSLAKRDQTLTENDTGTNGGYFYSFWKSDDAEASMTLKDGGEYSLTWTGNKGDVVGGKGWQTGSDRNITISGTYSHTGGSYLSVYGWTTDPLIEYYIVESYGPYNPGLSGTKKGSVESDGATYDIYIAQRIEQPSIQGTASFTQFWSVRQSKRVGGTVTVKNHFDKWAELGMTLGTFNYLIVATEGYESSGEAAITVS